MIKSTITKCNFCNEKILLRFQIGYFDIPFDFSCPNCDISIYGIKKIDENMSLHDFRMTPLSDKRTNLIFDAVIPPEYENRKEELRQRISDAAKSIDKTYFCVITFDIDFTRHN